MRISVIIPTCGRASVKDTVTSSLWADEIIVVPERPEDADTWGGGQRDRATSAATGDWLCFMDDDDVFTKDAEEILRRCLQQKATWHVFSMRYGNERTLWASAVQPGAIGTPMIVVPSRADLPRWSAYRGYMADYFFALSCKRLYGEPLYHREVIADIRTGPSLPCRPAKTRQP